MTNSEYSFEQDYNEAMDTINTCLIRLGKRLEDLEKHVQEIPTPDKTYYKPKGYEDYLDMRQNYDELYKRITKLEEMAHPKPTGATQKRNEDRLNRLEELINNK
tara:strand:- start:393 stop:704 length:312 start_codon:yes stop_codon:yes gene_type:complete